MGLRASEVSAATPSKLSQVEFIALIAMLFAMVAFSIDAMLPALPEIAEEISPQDRNRAQLILTAFILGMGVGTLFTGPLSDTFGRKPVICAGAALFIIGAAIAGQAESLETMLSARVLQGLGVAGPRIVAMAIVRDLYAGRRMAQIMSYAMIIFALVPAAAPLLGAAIISAFGWRMIFFAFILFCLISVSWLMIRQPETLPPENRRPFRLGALTSAVRECFSYPVFAISTAAQTLTFAILFATLSSKQQIFDLIFDRADSFPFWFALIALIGGGASLLNARLVMALGMRRMILIGLGGLAVFSCVMAAQALVQPTPFALFMVWATAIFFMVGLVVGNLNAAAMEPLPHVAGFAASIIGSVSAVFSVFLAAPVGLMFDGTLVPLAASITVLSGLGFLIVFKGLPN